MRPGFVCIEVASLIGSRINGNEHYHFVIMDCAPGVASLIGSRINGNQLIFWSTLVLPCVASLIGSRINGNVKFAKSIFQQVEKLLL